jgi:NAD(P)-dependent dehydrogenase (short-subunit alcohol dehydrogenase family)
MGRAAAECFATDGVNVAVIARTRADLDSTAHRLRELGAPDAFGVQADITQQDQVEAAFAQIGERWGALNILVNATGPVGLGTIETLADDEWLGTIDVGVMADGALCAGRAPAPAGRALGPDREPLRPLDQAAEPWPRRLHRGQGNGHQRHQELVVAPGQGRDTRQHGVTRQLRH